jgi:glutathione synthase/RimK-type ligase-like ATP-grasp enzyme
VVDESGAVSGVRGAASPLSIALATCAQVPNLTPDDQLLLRALVAGGSRAEPAIWDSAGTDWTKYDAVVIRSCWDYHLRLSAFIAWLEAVERSGTALWNPAAVLRWNADKIYLREVAGRGVDIVPTLWISSEDGISLVKILEQQGWDDAVVKPSVSASAYQTKRLDRASADAEEQWFRSLLRSGPALIQPFLRQIQTAGEWSLIFISGEFSHATLKQPAGGDFRVQSELGGQYYPAFPEPPMIETARHILKTAPEPCLYARVDGCVVEGRFLLMELELIEPVLFLQQSREAAERLAAGIVDRL